jgi:hypothetical protein
MYKKLLKRSVHPENGHRIGLFEVRGGEVFAVCKSCVFRRNCSQDFEDKNYYIDFPCGLLEPTAWLYIDDNDNACKTPFNYGK